MAESDLDNPILFTSALTNQSVAENDLDNPICRICMAAKSFSISILEAHETNEPALHKMISECNRYKVELDDSLPKKVCLECANDVRTAYRFKRKAEESYRQLCALHHIEVGKGSMLEKGTQTIDLCQCPICDKKLSRRDHLRRHVKSVHKMDLNKGITQEDEAELPMDCEEVDNSGKNDCSAKNPIMTESEAEIGNDTADTNFESIFCNEIKEEPGNDEKETVILENTENVTVKSESSNNDIDDDAFDQPAVISTQTKAQNEKTGNESPPLKHSTVIVEECSLNQSPKKKQGKKRAKKEHCCEICQHIFKRKEHLQCHIQSIHSTERPFACELCDKRFKRKDLLQLHSSSVHKARGFPCDLCDKAYVKKPQLTRHKETMHGISSDDYTVSECEFCKRKYPGKHHLERHLLYHTDRIFACRFCESTFEDGKQFLEHERSHSKRDLLCSICGQKFARNEKLKQHILRHSGVKPFKCQFCDKKFFRQEDVKLHERYHTGTRPHVCQICNKAFHRSSTLTMHMRTHTGEKPYKCSTCNEFFSTKAHLQRHEDEH